MTHSLREAGSAPDAAEHAAVFEHHRARLFGIAYRMLASVDDANDLVQEAYLRWHGADAAAIRAPEGWLVAVVTRLAIDRARRASVERRHYVGQWLPEPLAIDPGPSPDRHAELASDLSMAFLVLLERLAPEERAAFLLREVLGAGYAEVARVLEKSEAACRQIVHRARQRVRAERPRFPISLDAKQELAERFLRALALEDQDALLAVVSENATFVSDGGGKVSATRRMVQGASRVVRLFLGIERKWRGRIRNELALLNGEPAMLTWNGDRLISTTSFDTDGERLVAFFRVLNPEKLEHLR